MQQNIKPLNIRLEYLYLKQKETKGILIVFSGLKLYVSYLGYQKSKFYPKKHFLCVSNIEIIYEIK